MPEGRPMTEREIVEAIKRGAPFMLTAGGPSSARQDVLADLQRCTNMALAELRGAVEREHSAHLKSLRLLLELVVAARVRIGHNGLCQAHSLHKRPCPHATAKDVLRHREGEL